MGTEVATVSPQHALSSYLIIYQVVVDELYVVMATVLRARLFRIVSCSLGVLVVCSLLAFRHY